MPIETGTTINDLNDSYPLSSDFISDGDDHLRIIKSILKTQFPGNGGGFDIPITVLPSEINLLGGLTGNVQDQLNSLVANLSAPSGTSMLFCANALPFGWSVDFSANDLMLRVVNTVPGGGGGTDSPIIYTTDHLHSTGDVTLTESQIPSHTHTLDTQGTDYERNGGSKGPDYPSSGENNVTGLSLTGMLNPTGGGQSHNHGDTSQFTSSFTPRYRNSVIGIKD